MNFNDRLARLRSRKAELEQVFTTAARAFHEMLEQKGPGWDDELHELSGRSVAAFQALQALEIERKELIREAHTAVRELIRNIGADHIVSICTWRDALEK